MLRMSANAGTENPVLKENEGRKMEDRETWENHVVRIDEDCETVPIAASKTLFKELALLHQENCTEKITKTMEDTKLPRRGCLSARGPFGSLLATWEMRLLPSECMATT